MAGETLVALVVAVDIGKLEHDTLHRRLLVLLLLLLLMELKMRRRAVGLALD